MTINQYVHQCYYIYKILKQNQKNSTYITKNLRYNRKSLRCTFDIGVYNDRKKTPYCDYCLEFWWKSQYFAFSIYKEKKFNKTYDITYSKQNKSIHSLNNDVHNLNAVIKSIKEFQLRNQFVDFFESNDWNELFNLLKLEII